MNGWRLVGLVAALLAAMSLYLGASRGWDVDGLRLIIRATARSSLLLFSLAFAASALVQFLPSRPTRWLRSNRRYLGVSFAVSHVIHLAAIIGLAATDRALFWQLTNVATIILAGTAYLFIAAMTATSFDRTAAWLGARTWKALHLAGGWYIWISFAVATGKRVPLDVFYWPIAALVLAVGVLRLMAMRRARVSLAG